MSADALVKPPAGQMLVQWSSSIPVGSSCTLPTFVMVVVGHKLNIQAELVDVTSGVDLIRRYAKSGLVEGRLVCTGYMVNGTTITVNDVVDNASGTGTQIIMTYGNSAGGKSFFGFIESIEINANKTQPYVGVAISFKLSGAVV